jgi:prevent-host-death family protein
MNPDFVDLLRAFTEADVRFMIVGAYALAVHGRPRATGALDVWIDATPENAPRVMQALAAFGAPVVEITQADFARPGVVYQIGVPPGSYRHPHRADGPDIRAGLARSDSAALRRARGRFHRSGLLPAQQARDRPAEGLERHRRDGLTRTLESLTLETTASSTTGSGASTCACGTIRDMAIIAISIRPMRSTNIADLRNRLTHYLREVRAGEEIVVRDRQRPIARIVPFTVDDQDADDAALVAAGLMRKGSGEIPASFWKARRARVTRRAAVAAVRADRDDG